MTSGRFGFLRRFLRQEDGVVSIQNMFLLLSAAIISAAAVDVTYFFSARSQLQVAADVAAHSALWTRNRGDAPSDAAVAASRARAAAIRNVEWGMPPSAYGRVVENADIVFGSWNDATKTFRVNQASSNAVMVQYAGQDAASDNALPTFMFRMIGLDTLDVRTVSVYTTTVNDCADDGLMGQVKVDLRSNNAFYRGICLFAPIIQINSGNTFQAGTMVTMPDPDRWTEYNQASTFSQNLGLQEALRAGTFDFYILERLKAGGNLRPGDVSLDTAMSTNSRELPSFINRATVAAGPIAATPTSTTNRTINVSPSSFQNGRVHRLDCTGGQDSITFAAGTYSNFVLLTNCILDMSGKVNLENLVLSTTSTDDQSIRTSSGNTDGLVIGKDDSCTAGGGVRIFTRGGFKSAAKLEVYGSQILALKDINFTAGGSTENEIEGVSIISGGTVSGTSGNDFTGCPNGTNDASQTIYFRAAW